MPPAKALRTALDATSRRLNRLSLRARLLVGLVLVASAGLVIANVVIYGQIASYLNAQVDNELQSGASAVVSALNHPSHDLSGQLPLDTAAEVVYLTGGDYLSNPTGFTLRISSKDFSAIAQSVRNGSSHLSPFSTVGSSGGTSASYRVLPEPVTISSIFTTGTTGIAFIAIPLGSLNGTLHRLILVDLGASAAVIALLALLGYAVVRVGMRPLVEIEETAGAIAGGDLARRVERDDSRTEVGRLGASLNTMLTQIEEAFARQSASEDRLRQFLADASHELRTPVTSIRGYSELFRRGAANRPEDLALAMRRIEDEAARMGVLVDDLLLLARLDQGRPLDKSPVDLAAIAMDAAADASVLEPDRTITLDASPVIVEGDEQRLRQVAVNLVQNAIKHTTPQTPIDVIVKAVGRTAILQVRDQGLGIPPEHIARIFERFYRADPSRSRESGGSGLGLAIVASIAEAHGGVARVASTSSGTTFTVELPLMGLPREPRVNSEEDRRSLSLNGREVRGESRESGSFRSHESVEVSDDSPSAAGSANEAGSGTRPADVLGDR